MRILFKLSTVVINVITSPLKGVLVSVGHVQDIHQTLVSWMVENKYFKEKQPNYSKTD